MSKITQAFQWIQIITMLFPFIKELIALIQKGIEDAKSGEPPKFDAETFDMKTMATWPKIAAKVDGKIGTAKGKDAPKKPV